MSKSKLVLAIAAISCVASGRAEAQGMPVGFREEFLRQFETSMSKFIALAEAMPDERYRWAPNEGVMPVAQVYAHVARYNYYYPESSLAVAAPAELDMAKIEQISDKGSLIDLLRQSGEHVRDLVARREEHELQRKTKLYGRDVAEWAVLLQLLAHMNEHLGQSIAYARMNGVVPPWSR